MGVAHLHEPRGVAVRFMDRCRTVALLISLSSVLALFPTSSLDISISTNGTDVPQCTNGSAPCLTLHYVLLSLSNSTCTAATSSASIAIYYDHRIVPASYAFQCQIALYIIGVGEGPNTQTSARTLTCVDATNERISIHNALSVYWENIQFYGCAGPDVYGLSHVDYSGCKIAKSGGMIVENTGSVNITQSTLSYAQNIPFESFITITQANVHLRNSIFIGSSKGATALWTLNSVLHLEGTLTFVNNSGVLGGALRLTESQVIVLGNVSVLFMDNYAQYGSALYVENVSCQFINTDEGFLDVNFTQSTAMGSSQSYIYTDDPNTLNSTCSPHPSTYRLSHDNKYPLVRTSPFSLAVTLVDNNNTTVYPGKDIFLDVNITDYFQNAVSCETDLSMSYANTSFISCNDPQYQFELSCLFSLPRHPSSITLFSASNINTTIRIKAKWAPETSNVSIHFACNTAAGNLMSSISFQLKTCPSFYMIFNNVTGMCECVAPLYNKEVYVCSSGVACLADNHWIGWIASSTGPPVILPCYFPYCASHNTSCPLTSAGTNSNSFLLGVNPDDQCSSNQGGLLCRACRDGYCFTHAPFRCIPRNNTEGVAVVIILLSLFLHLAKAVAVVYILSREEPKDKLLNSIGSGPIYSAYFFLGYIGRLPFGGLSQFGVLHVLVSAFRSVVLPTLDIFSYIPVCLLPNTSSGSLYLTGLRYLGVATLFTVLLVYNTMFRLCPRISNHMRTSPLRSICLLIVWVFYSLVSTSIDILKFNSLPEVDEVRVTLQPELLYFTGTHILLGLIAVLLVSFFAAPLIAILLLSQLLWKCFDLSRIKPFLDEFQYVYRDDSRWFASAYLVLWVAIVAVPDQNGDIFFIYALLLATFCAVVCFFQPYKVKWLNYADAVLLVDMFLIAVLFDQQLLQYQESVATTTLVYILVTLPLVYFGVGVSFAIASRLKRLNCRREGETEKLSNVKEPLSVHDMVPPPTARVVDTVVGVANFKNYREPLLSELDEH